MLPTLPLPLLSHLPLLRHRPQRAEPGRRRAAAALAGLVLASHLWLLSSQREMPGAQGQPPAPRPMQVRQIIAAALPAAAPKAAALAQASRPTSAPPPHSAAPAGPQPARQAPAAQARTQATAPGPTPTGADLAEPAADAPTPAMAPPPGAARPQVPVYATQPPSAATLHYEVQRGGRRGAAQLVWQPDTTGYSLNLRVEGGELRGLGAGSRGSFDAAGLAPDRFVDRRRDRDVRAANFQREIGSVSFSASPRNTPLQDGMQDRLSWMLQLPAVLQANPGLTETGAEVSLWVAGGRGHAGVWTFTVIGPAGQVLPANEAPLATLHLQRAAAQLYDTQVDVWLDPARQYLPVRVRLAAPPGEWVNELLLTGLDWTKR